MRKKILLKEEIQSRKAPYVVSLISIIVVKTKWRLKKRKKEKWQRIVKRPDNGSTTYKKKLKKSMNHGL